MITDEQDSVATRDNKETVASVFNSNGKIFFISDDGTSFHGEGLIITFKDDKMILTTEGIELHSDNDKHQFWIRLHQLLDIR